MRLTARLALAGLLLAMLGPAQAAPVRGLYEASVPVPDQSAAARDPALRQALHTVLVRVTGTRQLPSSVLDALLPRASVLVQGYGYEAAPAGKELRLRAQFDARAVEAELRNQAMPVWGANRPSHLVWIALRDDGQARAVLDSSSAPARAAAALATAETRGLPFHFPALDATDRQLVTFNELWSGRYDGVLGASRRYGMDAVVVARVGREAGRWVGRWALLDATGGAEEWASAHTSLEDALAAGIHELADREAQRYAIQAGHARDVRVQVSGVETLRDYGRVLGYLRGLNAVRDAQLEAAQNDLLVFRLRIDGEPEALTRAIAAGRMLRPADSGWFGSGLSYVLAR